jgi:hypothetical protein
MVSTRRHTALYIAFLAAFLAYSSTLMMEEAPRQRCCTSTRFHGVTSQKLVLLFLDVAPVKCTECNLTSSHCFPHETPILHGCETLRIESVSQFVSY